MHSRLIAFAALLVSTSAAATDLLPLKQGIYVPVGRACRGASNADIVNYWGGRHSLGTSQGECTIKNLTRAGRVYTIKDLCKNSDGQVIGGGDTTVRISGLNSFILNGSHFRYCGPKVIF